MLVVTTGFFMASASRIFNRVPPPMRKGTTYAADRAMNGRTSATDPVTTTWSDALLQSFGGGRCPTMWIRAAGTTARISGKISSRK